MTPHPVRSDRRLRWRARLALTGLAAALLPALAAPAVAAPDNAATAAAPQSQGYEVVDLGRPPGGGWGWYPTAVSDTGVVAGVLESEDGDRVVTWKAGVFTDLGPGDAVADVDGAGNVVGTREVQVDGQRYRKAWLWRADGTEVSLSGPVEGDVSESRATGINDRGQVVGWWSEPTDDAWRSGFTWNSTSGMSLLTAYVDESVGTWSAEATGLNDGGRTSGFVHKAGRGSRVVFWTSSGVEVVDGLLHPAALQQDGSFSGSVWVDDRYLDTRSVVWKDGVITPVSIPAGASRAAVGTRADDGRWLGTATVPHPDYPWATLTRPQLWLSGPAGPSVPLQDLVQTPGWTLQGTSAMNGRGEILAGARNGTRDAAVLLRPAVAQPSIERTAVEQRDVPTGDWVPVPEAGTIDGNVVRVSADVRNPGTSPLEVQVAVLRDGVDVTDPADVTIPAGQTRRVSLDWDTAGLAWDGQAPAAPYELEVVLLTADAEETDAETTTVTVRPRPVFLVHGFNADASTWEQYPRLLHDVNPAWPVYAIGDGQAAGVMNTGSLADFDTPVNTLTQNAMIMDGYIDQVRAELDAQYFDVVAHSMGGLISRGYVNTHLPEAADGRPAMNQLVMLGTPNHGSPCASLMRLHGMWELRPEIVAEYNARWTNPRGVPMSILAGDPLPRTCQSPVEGDGVVAVPSAVFGFPDRGQSDRIHTSLTGPEDFTGWVLPRLVSEPGARAASLGTVDTEPTSPAPQLLTATTLTVPAGGTTDLVLQPGQAQAFGVTVAATGVTAALVDPAGRVVSEATAEGPFTTVSADDPVTGPWTLRLSSPAAVSAPVSAWVQGSPLELAVRGARGDGGRAELVVDLQRSGSPVPGAAVVAELGQAGQQPVRVPLTVRGDGTYAARPALPEGRYLVSVTATTGGEVRTTLTSVTVSGQAEPEPDDQVAPTTVATVGGKPVGGWYRDDVEVVLSASDEGSGVRDVRYRIGDGVEQVVPGDRAIVRVTTEGVSRLTSWAVDREGNAEQPSVVEVRLDRTAPTLACTATPGAVWPPNHKLVSVQVNCRSADTGSGAGAPLLLGATSSEADDAPGDGDGATTGDLSDWTPATPDTAGRVRAERLASGPGRTYALRYRVTDAAGNATEATATVRVPVSASKPG